MAWRIITQIPDERVGDLRELFRATWWADQRTDADIRALLAGSSLVVGLQDTDSGRLVGFCRAITDGRFLAVILDVITHPDIRGQGGGHDLMYAMLSRPELTGVASIELVCQPDLVDFYQRFGFTDEVGGSRLMRRTLDPRLVRRQGDSA